MVEQAFVFVARGWTGGRTEDGEEIHLLHFPVRIFYSSIQERRNQKLCYVQTQNRTNHWCTAFPMPEITMQNRTTGTATNHTAIIIIFYSPWQGQNTIITISVLLTRERRFMINNDTATTLWVGLGRRRRVVPGLKKQSENCSWSWGAYSSERNDATTTHGGRMMNWWWSPVSPIGYLNFKEGNLRCAGTKNKNNNIKFKENEIAFWSLSLEIGIGNYPPRNVIVAPHNIQSTDLYAPQRQRRCDGRHDRREYI